MFEVLEKQRNETARQYAIRVLRHNILYLNLKPGQPISESEIGELLGLSRTPIREAFKDLEKTHIIEVLPQKGTFVASIDFDLVHDALFLRLTLEKAILAEACSNMSGRHMALLEENLLLSRYHVERNDMKKWFALDNAFHRLLFQGCGKGRIYDYMESMLIHFDRIRILGLEAKKMQVAFGQHLDLWKLIKSRDVEKAIPAMENHLSSCMIDKPFIENLQSRYSWVGEAITL